MKEKTVESSDENTEESSDEESSPPSVHKPTYVRNMNAKGSSGVKKRIFKQGYRKRKRKPGLNLDVGLNVVFKSKCGEIGKDSLYVGKIKSKVGNDTYVVQSLACDTRECRVTAQDNPVAIEELTLKSTDMKKGMTVLAAWHIITDFVEVIPAQVVEVVDTDYVWVKPSGQNCVKVHIDNVIKMTEESQTIHDDLSEITVSHEQLNVVRLMLHATQYELQSITTTYNKTLHQLKSHIKDSGQLREEMGKLEELYGESLQTADVYRQQLMSSIQTDQNMNTLQELIAKQKQKLGDSEKRIIALDTTIRDLRTAYQTQTMELDAMRKENAKLKDTIRNLHKGNQNLYQFQPATGGVQVGKKLSNKTRPTSFLPISVPNINNPSSKASRLTLKRRAEQLGQVLNVISAREDPSSADIIQTLAAYLRENPDIAIPACKAAKINFATDLSSKDAVDLKVLLRLPMTRMRDLRRFLSKFNVNLLPSDKQLYDEMSTRQYQSKDMVEVGVVAMKKTVHAKESQVSFFRIKNLEDYICQHIEKQMTMENTWSDPNFENELWIKIGGDKGGTSTKLAFQFVNQQKPNSADSTNILAMFEATDSYTNMEVVFTNFTDQLASLQRRGTLKVHGVVYPLRIFYFGDTEFLCKIFGHMGPSSSYPCLWCHVPLKQLRSTDGKPHCPMKLGPGGKWVRNESWPENRTLRSYQQDIANLLAEEEDEMENTRVSGRDHHSMARRPILPLPFDILQIVPPALHILLGLVVRYFKKIEDKCRQLDQGSLQDRDEQLYKDWQTDSESAKEAELNMHDSKEVLEEESSILRQLNRAMKGRSNTGVTTDSCCMPMCKLAVLRPEEVKVDDVTWIRCTVCGEGETKGWFHTYCVGISKEDYENVEYDCFECPVCTKEISGPQDVIKSQEEKVAACKALADDRESDYRRKKEILDETYKKVEKSRGTFEERLNEGLKRIGVQRQAYHSQCFVGNHCKKILENLDALLEILPESDFRNNFVGLFKRMRLIFKLFKSQFLTDEEVRALKFRCWELGTWFPKKFPKESIPPKMHMLVCHIPEFVEKWNTVGLLSEHGLESVHRDVNSIERIYCTVRDGKERMRLVIGNHQQRGQTEKASIQVCAKNKKTCYMFEKTGCKGRYKMRSPGSKERVCQKCGHVLVKT